LSFTHHLIWSATDTIVERVVLAGEECCEAAGIVFDQGTGAKVTRMFVIKST
jgi:hypothetical protein